MSNYCKNCAYNPRVRIGENACPFNFLYWDFLARHYDKLKNNHRMTQILRNLERIPANELQAIRAQASLWHKLYTVTEYPLPSTLPTDG